MPSPVCPKCQGRMFKEQYDEPCKRCKDIGATSCQNCYVHTEWSCLQCGKSVSEPRRRRSEMPA